MGLGDSEKNKKMAQYPGPGYFNQTTQQPNQMWGNLLSMIPTVGPILGGIANQITSRIGINKQNQYNSPASQVNRMREAGLPMAALSGTANAGQQSTVPQAHIGGGITEGSKNIGLYAQTQQTQKATKLLNEQIRIQKAEADLKEGERNYKLGQAGTNVAGTNQTETMISEQNLKLAEAGSKELLNEYQKRINENQPTRTEIENQAIIAGTAKTLKDKDLVNEKITTEQLEQDLKNIQKEWDPQMKDSQKKEILARTGLIGEQTTGAQLENIIKDIDGKFKTYTLTNELKQSDIDTAMKKVMSADQWAKFTQTKEYNEMLDKARAIFQGGPGSEENFNPLILAERLSALLYTSFQQFTGMAGKLLGQ